MVGNSPSPPLLSDTQRISACTDQTSSLTRTTEFLFPEPLIIFIHDFFIFRMVVFCTEMVFKFISIPLVNFLCLSKS